jgi:alpha-beta hydrolase superfamily lysophospholipase
MRQRWRLFSLGLLLTALALALASGPGVTQPRAHVYLFRGLADVYSLGMNTLANELNARGVEASAHSHTDWKPIADTAAANYKAGREGPIILVGHSLGADAVMEMADYLGDKGVPVALVVPFDGTQSFPVPGNVARCINFTQRDYAKMRPGPGFRGSLTNVDLSGDHSIDHLTIDKSPRLHAQVISEVLAIVGGRRAPAPVAKKPANKDATAAEALPGGAAAAPANAAPPAAPPAASGRSPAAKAAAPRHPINPADIPD